MEKFEKFENYLLLKIRELNDDIATIIFERDKYYYDYSNKVHNEDESYSLFRFDSDKVIKLYQDLFYDILLERINAKKVVEEHNMVVALFGAHNGDFEKLLKAIEEKGIDYEKVKENAIIFNICKCFRRCFETENPDEREQKILDIYHKQEEYVDVLNYFESLDCDQIELTCSYKNVVEKIESYNPNSRELNKIISTLLNNYLKISNEGKDVSNAKEIDYYAEIATLLKDYKVESIDDLSEDELYVLIKKIGFSEKSIDKIRNLKNTEEKEEVVNINIESGLDTYERKEEINKELKAILSEYFDLKDMHLKRFLSRKETNTVLIALNRLGYKEDAIRDFIWENEALLNQEQLIIKCNYIKEKAEFYSSKYGFEKEYNDFLEYYNGYFETKDEEEKAIYLDFLELSYNEINSFLNSIPRTYEYEMSKSNDKNFTLKKEM